MCARTNTQALHCTGTTSGSTPCALEKQNLVTKTLLRVKGVCGEMRRKVKNGRDFRKLSRFMCLLDLQWCFHSLICMVNSDIWWTLESEKCLKTDNDESDESFYLLHFLHCWDSSVIYSLGRFSLLSKKKTLWNSFQSTGFLIPLLKYANSA